MRHRAGCSHRQRPAVGVVAKDILQNQRGEGAGEGDDDLVLVQVALQQLGIAGVGKGRSHDADVVAALHGGGDIVGDHVQLHGTLQLGMLPCSLMVLVSKTFFMPLLNWGISYMLTVWPLRVNSACHGVSAVAAAQDCNFLGSHKHSILSFAQIQKTVRSK